MPAEGFLERGDGHHPELGKLHGGVLVPEHEALALQPIAQGVLRVGHGGQVEDAGPWPRNAKRKVN